MRWDSSMDISSIIEKIELLEKEYIDKGLRKGQSLSNAVHVLLPTISDELVGTEVDCFYDDSKYNLFKNEVHKRMLS